MLGLSVVAAVCWLCVGYLLARFFDGLPLDLLDGYTGWIGSHVHQRAGASGQQEV